MKWALKVLTAIVLTAFVMSPAKAQRHGGWALWGEMFPGRYQVGFRVIYGFDRTRTWLITRAYKKEFSPDPNGRPIRISVWYPAALRSGQQPMRFEDYIKFPPQNGFSELASVLERHDRAIAALDVPADQMEALFTTSVNAYMNAAPAKGKFPLVLLFGGLNSASTIDHSVTAEYLASHGYIVATVPTLGPSNEQTDQARTQSDVETAIRDMEFAWSLLRVRPNVDNTKLGVMGHSLGGIEALIFAMRNENVSAVIGLDATYGFAGATKVLTDFYGYAPQRMRANFLDLRKAEGEQETVLDLSATGALKYADRTFITVRRMHHSDFTTFAMLAQVFHLGNTPGYVDKSGWTRESGYQGYQVVCSMVRDYLDQVLKGEELGASQLAADVARADTGVLRREKALPAPPSPNEFAVLIAQQGYEAAAAIVEQYRRDEPPETIVNESVFNSLGYNLIAQKRFPEAIGILRLVTLVYPRSANAADSLGDAYLASNQNDNARAAYQHALELVMDDPRFGTDAKRAFAKDEQTKIEQLKH